MVAIASIKSIHRPSPSFPLLTQHIVTVYDILYIYLHGSSRREKKSISRMSFNRAPVPGPSVVMMVTHMDCSVHLDCVVFEYFFIIII